LDGGEAGKDRLARAFICKSWRDPQNASLEPRLSGGPSAMKITVILCTYNRCQLLPMALERVAASTLPPAVEWEVLVIDNNSRDQTREVVEDFCRRYPGRFRYVFEGQPGKSYALNTGIREARGEILAFVDDDVTVDPQWLRNLTVPLADGQWAGAGGRTVPSDPFSPPDWLSKQEPIQWGGVLGGLFDLGDKPCELRMAPYGTNMAFRKEMFQKYGGFRVDLGPRPGNLIRNEDTEFGRRLMAGGERLHYEPSALVYHEIQEGRARKDYFLAWWFDYGRALTREEVKPLRAGGTLTQHGKLLAVLGAKLLVRTYRWMKLVNPHRRFHCKCRVWMTMGQILEICGK
jgi:glycosyltransferase involved in cell wall biosynthesis